MSILQDEATRSISLANWTFPQRSAFYRLRDRAAAGNPAGKSPNGPTHRGRAGRRLFYRAALFQTRFQILGVRSPPGSALERGPARNVEREAKARTRPGGIKIRRGQQLRIQTLRLLQWRQSLRTGKQQSLSRVRPEKLRTYFDESAGDLQKPAERYCRRGEDALHDRKAGVTIWLPLIRATRSPRNFCVILRWNETHRRAP